MGLDVYFRKDIANAMRAVLAASEGSAGLALQLLDPEVLAALSRQGVDAQRIMGVYRAAVLNTLCSLGLSFGLEPTLSQEDIAAIQHGGTPSTRLSRVQFLEAGDR